MLRRSLQSGLLVALLLLLSGAAQAQQTVITGVLPDAQGNPDPHGELWLYQSTVPLSTPGAIRITTDSQGRLLDPVTRTPGFKVPRNSQIRVFSLGRGLNSCRAFQPCSASPANGVWLTVPDLAEYTLEAMAGVQLNQATFGNPMTTPYDLIIGGANGTAQRLPKGGNGQVLTVTGGAVVWGSTSGTGTVTDFSAGDLSPLFTSSVASSTGTPALTFSLSSQTANRFFAGPTSGGPATPTFRALAAADIPSLTSLYAATSHSHAESDVTNLVSDLAGKAASSHTHSESDVTGLAADLAAKQDALGFTPVPTTRTVNGHALSSNVTVTPGDLSLVIGTNTQAHSADLDAIAGLSPSNDDVLQRKAGAWINRSIAQLKTDLFLSGSNTGDQTLNSLLPSQSGHSGEFLTTNGTNASWASAAGSGGGTTINATDNFIPYRSSSTAFANSPLSVVSGQLRVGTPGTNDANADAMFTTSGSTKRALTLQGSRSGGNADPLVAITDSSDGSVWLQITSDGGFRSAYVFSSLYLGTTMDSKIGFSSANFSSGALCTQPAVWLSSIGSGASQGMALTNASGGSVPFKAGNLLTDDPTSGSGPTWKFGAVKSATVSLSTSSYVEVSIGGATVKLAIVN